MSAGQFKYGRRPATRPAALADLAVYAQGKLPVPPPTVEVPPGPFPIDGNDTYGDCVMAGVDHLNRAWDKMFDQRTGLPPEQAIVAEYLKLSPGDEGLVESELLMRWHREGLFGEHIAGYAPVPPHDLLQLHQGVAFYGGLMLGIECGPPQQEQFAKNETWTYTGSEEEEGHCVVGLGYGPVGGIHVATWGGIAVLSAGYLAHKLREAWVVLSHQLVEARKDTLGLDLKTLEADLKRV